MLLDPLPSYSIHPRKGEISIHEIPTEEKTDLVRFEQTYFTFLFEVVI